MSTQLLSSREEIATSIIRLANHPDFKAIIDAWRVKLADMYSEMCARPDTLGREWYAGRAALLETFLKTHDSIVAEGSIKHRPVAFKASGYDPLGICTLAKPSIDHG